VSDLGEEADEAALLNSDSTAVGSNVIPKAIVAWVFVLVACATEGKIQASCVHSFLTFDVCRPSS